MEYLPGRNYMAHHPSFDWRKRAILIEWVMSIHGSTTFHLESFYLFVNNLDRCDVRTLFVGKLKRRKLIVLPAGCQIELFEVGRFSSSETSD